MKAIFEDMQTMNAATWVAKQGGFGLLRLKRERDMMEVIGTDGYVMLQASVGCDFEDWPDGGVIEIVGSINAAAVRKVIGGHPESQTRPLTVSVEYDGDASAVVFDRMSKRGVRRTYRCEAMKPKLDMDALERSMEEYESEPEGRIQSYLWGKVGQVIGRLPYAEWTLANHGPTAAFELTSGSARILAMPSVRRAGYGSRKSK